MHGSPRSSGRVDRATSRARCGEGDTAIGSAQTLMDSTLRSTRQRRAVVAQLAASDEFWSAQEIHDAIRREGDRVGLATVCRSLQSLVHSGEVDVVKTGVSEAVYRRCSPVHHHHLVCRSCGRTVEIEGPGFEQWARHAGREERLHRGQSHPGDLRPMPGVHWPSSCIHPLRLFQDYRDTSLRPLASDQAAGCSTT